MGETKYRFQKLTPKDDVDISVYKEAIDFVFENSDVKNVAISGAYSAGKSSILESYKAKNKKYRFVHLSLAHFRTPEQELNDKEENIKESVLEGKILNQLIHQIQADKIPQTNFRVKKEISAKNLTFLTAYASTFIWSVAYLILFSNVVSYVATLPDNWIKSIISILFSPYAIILVSILSFACSIFFICSLVKTQKNRNIFRKVSLQGNEIEIFEEHDESYFDKYLNEVLYLFENVEADVIVFEDMDRFNASRIFERLHEVNTLVNIHRMKQKSDNYVPLRFFYLLRDDIYVSKDRTKFFDFIIPVVPVVDSSNSYEQFLKHLKEGTLLDKFDQSFLQSLSLYVDDMRILKNIYNEFVVYIYRLNTTDLDWNKMMAMIAYKNLFPRDFNDLQLARGFVFNLFEQKTRLIEDGLKKSKEQRQELLDRMEWVKKENLTSQQELDDVYTAKDKQLPRTPYNNSQLTRESQELKHQYDAELVKRKQALQDILDGNIANLESILKDIEHDIVLIRTKMLKDLITRANIDSVFAISHISEIGELNEFKEIKRNDYFALLKFLISRGFIDETYTDYMTYFYDDSISANDKVFLRRVTDRREAEYTYALREPHKVIESPVLRDVEFEQEETLNFDLLECLLLNNTKTKYETYLKILLSQIRETSNFGFISEFYDTGKAKMQLIMKLNEQWSDFFLLALRGKNLPSNQIRQYSIDTFYFCDVETITTINVDNCLTEYVSNCPDYLEIKQPDVKKLVSGFSHIGVSFNTIDYEKADKTLFDEVYQNSLYTLTFENISLMLRNEFCFESESDIMHKNYTMVMSRADSSLAEYVSENMSTYIEIVLNHCEGMISDDESIVISLLNNEIIENEAKIRYIELLSTDIVEITQVIEPDLWVALIEKQIVAYSESNFINYYLKHGIDSIIVDYINNAPSEVDFRDTVNNFDSETAEGLYDAIIVCNEISTVIYKKILLDLNYYFDKFEAAEIEDDKFKVLIAERIIQMDTISLDFVREKYEQHLFAFIERNLEEYITLQTNEIFKIDEALQLITWDIHDDMKIELLSFTNEGISIIGKQYSDSINAHILTNNFKVEDKPILYMNYSLYGEQSQLVIARLAINGALDIITNNMKVNDSLLSILLQADLVKRDHKIMLLTMAIPGLNEESCKLHFDELGLSDLNGIFSKGSGRRNYEKSWEIAIILDILKLNGWIYEYHDDERNINRYVIIKNRPRRKVLEILD
jgi:hypothetical protein